ncbi:hypothetical protein IQ247_07475 [Plectonema cf. radiosum LEGE 06105]|uniref:Uncharacterized protein n=1 Tax=Plectonema cf. radiosum LEGE 06105 TaxID=945769 RepID=A0A8J7F3H9_9CYAN|nr:hypothetical protein [Plectonema radiosum]MBE9212555.1 hypothetical protein [Plectonema cf. radiosum LEGE 06105]
MTFLTLSQPLLRDKQEDLDYQDLQGIWRISGKIGNIRLISGFYTRIDQVFIIWGLVCTGIFTTAQFLPISWVTQAILWTTFTIIGTAMMIAFTWFWVSVERLRWLIYAWIILILSGVVLTDAGIFLGWGEVLMRLCPLWLGLSAVGYMITAWAVKSRTFVITAAIHLLGILLLPYCGGKQFLATGLVMGISLLLLAELQWEMRPPIDYDVLTAEQKEFNQQQNLRRQLV